ncbi:MAG: hypothetical protein JOY53_15580 [Acidobacteriaceae bacterium]|nr:hypothetical protein [Acidobacteriaceae bacterium]
MASCRLAVIQLIRDPACWRNSKAGLQDRFVNTSRLLISDPSSFRVADDSPGMQPTGIHLEERSPLYLAVA